MEMIAGLVYRQPKEVGRYTLATLTYKLKKVPELLMNWSIVTIKNPISYQDIRQTGGRNHKKVAQKIKMLSKTDDKHPFLVRYFDDA